MFKSINAIEFNRRFIDNKSCYQYLMNRKWGKGFSCSFCGCKESIKGRTYYYRRCKSCRYDESVTANTVFHSIKMPILKAFHMVFRITAKKKGMSTVELGCEVGVQQKTAWLFKRKIQVAMKPDKSGKLEGNVDVDETLLGFHTGRKDGGRSLENREAVFIAAEILEDGRTGNLGMHHIENFKADTLECALKDLTSEMASIRSDNYCSYRTIQRDLSNLKIESSQNGKAFEELHRQIMLFKNWLVGIHHKWSKQHLHAYCDEYVFRFNRRNIRKSIFNSVINKMMQQIPHPYPVIKTLCEYST
jgi:ISXO2-like transposase domain/Transposase zinc-ribbon domain